MYRVPYVPVALALIAALAALALLFNSCFAERPTDQNRTDRPEQAVSRQPEKPASEDAGKPPEEASSEPSRSLVPVAHLTSTRESVSMEELSQDRDLGVPRGYLEAAQAQGQRRVVRRAQ